MMYLDRILWFLSWPLSIAISYFLVVWVLNKWKDKIEDPELDDTVDYR